MQAVSRWSLRPWCAGARVWVLWTPVPRRVRDSLQVSRVQTLRASSCPSGGLSCILTTWPRLRSSPPSVKSPSGPTLGGGCSAALEARRAQLSLPPLLPGQLSLGSSPCVHTTPAMGSPGSSLRPGPRWMLVTCIAPGWLLVLRGIWTHISPNPTLDV